MEPINEATTKKQVIATLEKARVRVTGNGYAFFVPKALIDCKVIDGGILYDVEIKPHKPVAGLKDDDAVLGILSPVDFSRVGCLA